VEYNVGTLGFSFPNCASLFHALTKQFPSWYIVFFQLTLCVVTEEILFYYSHRLLHYGSFYTKIHKIHHEFRAPIGIASEYCHPIEMVVSNIIPVVVGPMLCQAHILVSWMWFSLAIAGTISNHSGYLFPWLIGSLNPSFHDYHHYSFISNFGFAGWLDRLHGTDKGYKEYVSSLSKKEK